MEYERVGLVKPEVFVYRIPPRVSARAVRAADWDLANPSWKGRMRVVSRGDKCVIKLEDKHSGDLFAQCPVDAFPGIAVEPVSDSSRYFVLRLQDPSGQHAFVGMGFEDRGDAFDFNVALQDHFKALKQSKQLAEEEANPMPHKDYSLKEGQKIKINLKTGHSADGSQSKSTPAKRGAASGGILPPPPAGGVSRPIQPPPSSAQQQKPSEDWGDFASFGQSSSADASGSSNWVQF